MPPLSRLTLVVALAAVGCGAPPPDNVLRASGHVEATEIRLAADAGGRLLDLTPREGDRVQVGTLVARFDARDVELALDRTRAEREAAYAQLRLVQAPARAEDVAQADAQIDTARADLAAARAELDAAIADLARHESLVENRAGALKPRDDAATRRRVAEDRVTAAESRVRAAEQARARLVAGARPEEVEVARARLTAVDAQIAALEKALADTVFHAPAAGVVTARLVEPGEVIPPRAPLLVIADLDRPWADIFVPEPAVPRIRLGQTVTLFTDAGGPGLEAAVTWISPRAEFTPRNVQTAEERSKLVYRVRVHADNRTGVLKQGMPVEADIPLAETAVP